MAGPPLNAWIPFLSLRDVFVDPKTGRSDPRAEEWWLSLWTTLNRTPQERKRITHTAEGASIGNTTIPLASMPDKLYRVNVFAQVVRAGSVSSSLIVRIRAVSGGNTVVVELGPMTSNSLTMSNIAQSVVVHLDQDGPLSYNTAYVDGGGATSMLYDLHLSVEEMPS
jgi:hypothetical protein